MKLKRFFVESVPEACASRRYHGLAYNDIMRRRRVMVLWPFNYLVCFAAWLDLVWCTFINRPSWIDREVAKRSGERIRQREDDYRRMMYGGWKEQPWKP